jgi:hypothetical protein
MLIMVALVFNLFVNVDCEISIVSDSILRGFGLKGEDENYWPGILTSLVLGNHSVSNYGMNSRTVTKDLGVSYQNTGEYKSALKSTANIVLVGFGTNDAM